MTINDLLKQAGLDLAKVKSYFVETLEGRAPATYREEYDGVRTRRTTSVGFRESKEVGEGDSKKTIFPAQIVFGFPKKIVSTATAFLCGGEMVIESDVKDDPDTLGAFKKVWGTTLKMNAVIKEFTRTVMIETKSAVVFYPQKSETDATVKLRCKVLKYLLGTEFYPHFDQFGDLDAFIWSYSGTDSETQKSATFTRVWTAETEYVYTTVDGTTVQTTAPNLFGKIPVVYAETIKPEWDDIATLLDRFEMRVSRLSDCNDYFAEPLLKLYGTPKNLPGKDTIGKVVEFDNITLLDGKTSKGDAEYLTWDQTPASVKLELETLWNGIYGMSNTPNTNFDNVKGIGNAISGLALKLMFIDALIKADENKETFAPAYQRMVNVVKAGLGGIVEKKYAKKLEEMNIEVSFGMPLPDDMKEKIEVLLRATGDKAILSQKSAVSINPLVTDSDAEMIQLTTESEADNVANQDAQTGTFFAGQETSQ